jgi:hypothetical protein
MRKLIAWLLAPYHKYKHEQMIKKRLKELRARDPFIYK